MATNAVIARRRLAQGLRRYRQRAGMTIEDLARELDCSVAKISRLETGISGVRLPDLRMIADAVGLDGADRVDLEDLVRRARAREWWQEYLDLVPEGAATFLGLEDGAAAIRMHHTSLVPGLLQTAGYTQALFVGGLDEAPDQRELRREIGGAEVMADQWEQLLAYGDRGVEVRVIPFTAPAHPAEGVSFTVFGFDHVDLSPIVYAEQLSRNAIIDEPDEVKVYLDALTGAEAATLCFEESRDLIAARVAELRA
jgi:transcriptional regulator with XRE-family HTH domain